MERWDDITLGVQRHEPPIFKQPPLQVLCSLFQHTIHRYVLDIPRCYLKGHIRHAVINYSCILRSWQPHLSFVLKIGAKQKSSPHQRKASHHQQKSSRLPITSKIFPSPAKIFPSSNHQQKSSHLPISSKKSSHHQQKSAPLPITSKNLPITSRSPVSCSSPALAWRPLG